MTRYDNLPKRLPDKLYHYTRRIQRIVDRPQPLLPAPATMNPMRLRARHVLYLDDAGAFTYPMRVVRHELATRIAAASGVLLAQLQAIDAWAAGFVPTVLSARMFAIPLSELDDDLGMWRGYGMHGPNVAIGFSAGALGQILQGFQYVRCLYDPAAQAALANHWIDDVLAAAVPPSGANVKNFFLMLLTITSPTFAAERGWRLVLTPENTDKERWRFESREETLIPYIEALLETAGVAPILEFVVGPSALAALAYEAVIALANTYQGRLLGHAVRASAVPLRRW